MSDICPHKKACWSLILVHWNGILMSRIIIIIILIIVIIIWNHYNNIKNIEMMDTGDRKYPTLKQKGKQETTIRHASEQFSLAREQFSCIIKTSQ